VRPGGGHVFDVPPPMPFGFFWFCCRCVFANSGVSGVKIAKSFCKRQMDLWIIVHKMAGGSFLIEFGPELRPSHVKFG